MLSFNPLNTQDYHGLNTAHPKHQAKHAERESPGQIAQPHQGLNVQYSLSIAYERLQGAVSGRMKSEGAPGQNHELAAISDFTPQAVSDRIMGFVGDRLEQERQNGASEGRIQQLYHQALKGVEQGLREAKGILESRGLLQGETKQNFYDTVNLVANDLEQLGESLFGAETPALERAVSQSASVESLLARQRTFEMEVVTQDGDRVTLQVQAGQQLTSGSDVQFTSFDNLAFSVEGELDEEERAALTDLFQQVNAVAGEFYDGDVEQAFEQAMTVGMNTDQLAAFAVNMHKAETMAVNKAYSSVDNMAGSSVPNPMADLMERLAGFADKLRQARDQLESTQESTFNSRELLDRAVTELYPSTPALGPQDNSFEQFVGALA